MTMSVCVCLSAGSSLVAPFPRLIAESSLRAANTSTSTSTIIAIIIIIVTITYVSKPSRTVDSPRILYGHL